MASQTQPQNRLFDPGTLRNQSELEPTDDITRSTTPHERQVVLALAIIVAFVAAWASFPFVNHSVWLEGERADGSSTLADASDAFGGDVLRLRVHIAPHDAAHLAPGLTAYVSRNGVADSFIQGSIVDTDANPSADPLGMRTIALRIPRDPSGPLSLASESSSDDAVYRLRIPVGIQTPFETLVGFLRAPHSQPGASLRHAPGSPPAQPQRPPGGTEGGAPQEVRTNAARGAAPTPVLGRAYRAVI